MPYSRNAFDILQSMPTATVWEAAGKMGDVHPRIKLLVLGARLAGPALCVKIFPGETYGVLRAIEAAPTGSVIVVDCGGERTRGLLGGDFDVRGSTEGSRRLRNKRHRPRSR